MSEATADTQIQALATEKQLRADIVIKNNVLWSLGGGVVPIPLIDLVAITAVQVKMLKEISDVYGVTFCENKVKNIVAALIGGVSATGIGRLLMASAFKFIPVVGPVLGAVSVPAVAGAITYAVGKVFVQHFESGGTFLDFDPERMKEFFARQYEEGKIKFKNVTGIGKDKEDCCCGQSQEEAKSE